MKIVAHLISAALVRFMCAYAFKVKFQGVKLCDITTTQSKNRNSRIEMIQLALGMIFELNPILFARVKKHIKFVCVSDIVEVGVYNLQTKLIQFPKEATTSEVVDDVLYFANLAELRSRGVNVNENQKRLSELIVSLVKRQMSDNQKNG